MALLQKEGRPQEGAFGSCVGQIVIQAEMDKSTQSVFLGPPVEYGHHEHRDGHGDFLHGFLQT